MARISVLGAGTWGVALANVLAGNGHDVSIWSAIAAELKELEETHTQKNLPGLELNQTISFCGDLPQAVKDRDILVMAVASPYIRKTAGLLSSLCPRGQVIVNVAKGIEEATQMTMAGVIEDEVPQAVVAVLSGPSHAEEVSRGLVTSVVIGHEDHGVARYLQQVFINDYFRVYTSPDRLGIELGAAIKNVIALAAGIADGLGLGDNCKAALITRGIVEITRLGKAMGGNELTFYGLSGIGDLIVTCASMHSRNRRAGILIGQGKTMEEAMAEVKMIVEGVYSCKAAVILSRKYGVSMPIVSEVNEILFGGKSAAQALRDLMQRDARPEQDGYPTAAYPEKEDLGDRKIILASASPRRRELMARTGFPFRVSVSDCDESCDETDPRKRSMILALRKAEAVFDALGDEEKEKTVVVGSDTLVYLPDEKGDGTFMGKPADANEAAAMLRMLSGKVHFVQTGVALIGKAGRIASPLVWKFSECTGVEFYPLTEEEIQVYVAGGEPMDKAGAYGIQGLAGRFVKRVIGNYDTVVGLPVSRLYHELTDFLSTLER